MSPQKIKPVLKVRVKLIPLPIFTLCIPSHFSYELQFHVACPPDSALPCTPSQIETKYMGLGQKASLGGLQPYTTYKVRVVAHNEVGSTASEWINFTTQKECEYKWLLPQAREIGRHSGEACPENRGCHFLKQIEWAQ